MIVITDVNILLSALIKDSTVRKLLVQSGHDFCFPEVSLHKLRKYKTYIAEKAGLSEEELSPLIEHIFRFVRLIPSEELAPYWEDATHIMGRIDTEDIAFVAAVLSQKNAVLWSDDAHFDRQKRIFALKTNAMVMLFGD